MAQRAGHDLAANDPSAELERQIHREARERIAGSHPSSGTTSSRSSRAGTDLGKRRGTDACSIGVRLLALVVSLAIAAIVVLADTANLGPVLHLVARVPYGDKAAHFALMGVLALVISLALGGPATRRTPTRASLLGGVGVFVVVLGEELSQIFVETRTFDLLDLTADALGIALGAYAAWRPLSRSSRDAAWREGSCDARRAV